MRSPRNALINRNYARLWYGQAISTLGDYAFDTTLVLWVATVLAKGRTWGPVAVSGVLFAVGTAILLVGPLAGVFVDRWNRLGTMLRTEVVRCLLVLLLAGLSLLPVHDLPVWAWLTAIYAVVFALNGVGQFFSPARFAILGEVVQGEVDRARAAGIGQATNATAAIIGPPLAAPLLFAFGLQWALLFNAASYAVSFVAIRSIRLDPDARRTDRPRRQPACARTSWPACVLCRQPVPGGPARHRGDLPVRNRGDERARRLLRHQEPACVRAPVRLPGHGLRHRGGGRGALLRAGGPVADRPEDDLGLPAAQWRPDHRLLPPDGPRGRLALIFLLAVPVTMLNTAMTPLLLASAPREYMGRVIAIFNPAVQLAAMASVAAAGWLASSVLRNFSGSLAGVHFGTIDTIFAAAGLLVLLAGGYALAALPRRADQPGSLPSRSTRPRRLARATRSPRHPDRGGSDHHGCARPAPDPVRQPPGDVADHPGQACPGELGQDLRRDAVGRGPVLEPDRCLQVIRPGQGDPPQPAPAAVPDLQQTRTPAEHALAQVVVPRPVSPLLLGGTGRLADQPCGRIEVAQLPPVSQARLRADPPADDNAASGKVTDERQRAHRACRIAGAEVDHLVERHLARPASVQAVG